MLDFCLIFRLTSFCNAVNKFDVPGSRSLHVRDQVETRRAVYEVGCFGRTVRSHAAASIG